MWFPFQKTPRKKTVDGAIERYRRARQTRPMLGLYVDAAFERVVGAAVEVRGAGKWMRVRLLGHLSMDCGESLSSECRRAADGSATAGETVGIGDDLGEFCADVVERLLAKASLSVEDVLAVSVHEPGVRWRDYDRRLEFAPLFQPQRFAERTGLSVIDGLPAADVAAGGRGIPLDPLPMWLLFADRRPPLACAWRWLVELDQLSTITLFPPSDGLDAEPPEIQRWVLPGLGLFDGLDQLREADPQTDFTPADATASAWSSDRLATLAVQGRSQASLVEHATWDPDAIGDQEANLGEDSALVSWMDQASSAMDRAARQAGLPWADVYCSATTALVDQIAAVIGGETHEVTDVIVSGRGRRNGLVLSGLHNACSAHEIAVVDDCGFHSEALPAICSAVLGMMHVDQMPASLPWLTGCLVPRLLGRVTPGRPVYWRRLVTEMADLHPPAMKLRDAV